MNLWGEVLIQKIRKNVELGAGSQITLRRYMVGETVSKNCNNHYAILFIADLMFKLNFELDTFIFI